MAAAMISGNSTLWDTDFDGLPDWWEQQYYGDLDADNAGGSGDDTASDTDSDGFSALEEFWMGTDPTVADTNIFYVDDNGSYWSGNGTLAQPWKYLQDVLEDTVNVPAGSIIFVGPGTYQVLEYTVTRNLFVFAVNSSFTRTNVDPGTHILKGPNPGTFSETADTGQMVTFSSSATRFILAGFTMRIFKDDGPIIAYDGTASSASILVLKNLIFRENSTQSGALVESDVDHRTAVLCTSLTT